MSTGRFRCIHCGDRFDLSPEENESFSEGYYLNDPDCCDDCAGNSSYHDFDEYSDADPGL